jgi:hypothetical protein
MSLFGGRGGRSDDWPSPHARARARVAERLDEALDPAEDAWLDDHLASCDDCAATASDYASQRSELRALRDRTPLPPRDLWAKTAAAIEREAGAGRSGRRLPQSILAPYAVLAGAVIVAVAVGTLNLSRVQPSQPSTTPGPLTTPTGLPTQPAPTPILVEPGSVAYVTNADGKLEIHHFEFTQVCGPTTEGCESSGSNGGQPIGPVASPETVFGAAGDRPLVVVSKGSGSGGKVYAVAVASQEPDVTPPPSEPPSPSSTASPSSGASSTPSPTPTPTSAASSPPSVEPPSASPPASSEPVSPPPSNVPENVVEIARDLQVLDSTAAYAPDGSAFAFTARPSDGSHGPDIYVWHVGDPQAVAITTDHRSVFGSWVDDSIVGSTVTASPDGSLDRPLAFIQSGDATRTRFLLETGRAWRPVVDPTERSAVYWSGGLEATADGLGWKTTEGKLVLGRWDDVTASASPEVSASPDADATAAPDASATAAPDASATPPADADQPNARSETTIETGPLADWDARWDATGTRLAVWIADRHDPTVGRLSLYVVDPFNGRIDESKSPLADEPALAGFAIADGHLAWAAPPAAGSSESRVRVLAWTARDFGNVESAPGDVILVR